jgi:hypothetical protein
MANARVKEGIGGEFETKHETLKTWERRRALRVTKMCTTIRTLKTDLVQRVRRRSVPAIRQEIANLYTNLWGYCGNLCCLDFDGDFAYTQNSLLATCTTDDGKDDYDDREL